MSLTSGTHIIIGVFITWGAYVCVDVLQDSGNHFADTGELDWGEGVCTSCSLLALAAAASAK